MPGGEEDVMFDIRSGYILYGSGGGDFGEVGTHGRG